MEIIDIEGYERACRRDPVLRRWCALTRLTLAGMATKVNIAHKALRVKRLGYIAGALARQHGKDGYTLDMAVCGGSMAVTIRHPDGMSLRLEH